MFPIRDDYSSTMDVPRKPFRYLQRVSPDSESATPSLHQDNTIPEATRVNLEMKYLIVIRLAGMVETPNIDFSMYVIDL